MIGWSVIFSHGIWISALALGLGVVSFAYYHSRLENVSFLKLLQSPLYQSVLLIAGGFFCFERAILSQSCWLTVLWVLLTEWFLFQELMIYRK